MSRVRTWKTTRPLTFGATHLARLVIRAFCARCGAIEAVSGGYGTVAYVWAGQRLEVGQDYANEAYIGLLLEC